ncbi:MAG: hypothetical protein RIR65_1624 [Planctomycetota bacterium]
MKASGGARVKNRLVLGFVAVAGLLAWLYFARGASEVRAQTVEALELGEGEGDLGAELSNTESSTARDAAETPQDPSSSESSSTASVVPAGKARVLGRVVDRQGRAVVGARVIAALGDNWYAVPIDAERDLLERSQIETIETRTDGEGRYDFGDIQPGAARLCVRAAGFGPWYGTGETLPEGVETRLPDVVLDAGVVVRGKVVDPRGTPVAGATVLVAYDCIRRKTKLVLPGRGAPVATTNADGEFVVDQLAPGAWHIYGDDGVHLAGEARGELARAGLEQGGVRIELGEAWRIVGKVVPKAGALPAGLRVSARLVEEGQADRRQEEQDDAWAFSSTRVERADDPARSQAASRVRHALVDAEGAFQLGALVPSRKYRLGLARPRADGKGWRAVSTEELKPVEAGERNALIELRAATSLVFKVVDDATGAPIEDLFVWGGQGRERVLRDDAGKPVAKFGGGVVEWPELRLQAGGKPFQLRVAATGYKDHEARNLAVHAGRVNDLGEIRLAPTSVVEAFVYKEGTRDLVPGARVILADRSEEDLRGISERGVGDDLTWDPQLKHAIADDKGMARLTAPAGKHTALQASAKGCVPGPVVRQLIAEEGVTKVELFVRLGGVVEVVVDDGAGNPVPRQSIQHMLPPKPGEGDEEWGESLRTDDKGVARFEGLVEGLHKFRVEKEQGNVWTWGEVEAQEEPWSEARVASGELATLRLRAKPRGSLEGVVREDGRPLADAAVRLVPYNPDMTNGWAGWSGEDDPLLAVCDDEGRYRFESIPVGTYRLFVTHELRRHAKEFRADVHGLGSRQDLDLMVSSVAGRVLDDEGSPLAGLEVQLWVDGERIEVEPPYKLVYEEDERGGGDVDWKESAAASTKTDASGAYVMRGVQTEAGLTVVAQGRWTEEGRIGPFTLVDGEVRHGADFKLRRAGDIVVRLEAPMADDEMVHAHLVKQDGAGQLRRDFALGRWNDRERLRGLIPGEWKLVYQRHGPGGPQGEPREATIVVQVGREARHAIQGL